MPRVLSIHTLGLCSSVVTYYVVSQIIFNEVFLTSQIVIDEEFHVPQGLAYCNFTFNTWNPKITTLPGLYLVSAAILGPFNLCLIYCLRFVNLLASVLNLLLLYFCFTAYNGKAPWTNLVSSINVALLPPLYFFSHLYYTDIISLTFILLFVLFYIHDKHILASIFGMMAVVMRQTNIIWVLMIFGQYVLREFILYSSKKQSKKIAYDNFSMKDLSNMLLDLKNGLIFKRLPLTVWLNISAYMSILISFAVFVILNGSIVVGDKTAHMVSLHVPQMFYFITFCIVFGWPYFVTDVLNFLHFIRKTKLLTLLVVALFTVIIYLNTVEHPYLLADNRHYTFYIWHRFYRKYFWFRYLMVPLYYFGFYSVFSKLHAQYNVLHIFVYIVCISFVLVLQKMIEFRYFLIPYILFRLQLKNARLWQLAAEFCTYCVINCVTFKIFFTKDIYWSDFTEVQKLIW